MDVKKSKSKFSSGQNYLLILGNDCEILWNRYWLSIENNCNMLPFDIPCVSFGKPEHNISSLKQQKHKLKYLKLREIQIISHLPLISWLFCSISMQSLFKSKHDSLQLLSVIERADGWLLDVCAGTKQVVDDDVWIWFGRGVLIAFGTVSTSCVSCNFSFFFSVHQHKDYHLKINEVTHINSTQDTYSS
jgi:hypothetical protein